jgi:hypothetical protein
MFYPTKLSEVSWIYDVIIAIRINIGESLADFVVFIFVPFHFEAKNLIL